MARKKTTEERSRGRKAQKRIAKPTLLCTGREEMTRSKLWKAEIRPDLMDKGEGA